MTDQPTITAARKVLGRQLAELRSAANLTQSELADLVLFSRSTVGNVEAGFHTAGPRFWRTCDEVLMTGGTLRAAHDELVDFTRELHRSAAGSAQGLRHSEIAQWRRDRTAGSHDPAEASPAPSSDVDPAITNALTTLGGCGAYLSTGSDGLETRVLTAYQQHRNGNPDPLSLILVGGFAGSGKTEFARFLSAVTGWTILDKDTITRALVEQLLLANGGDPNDRHTPLYMEHVRPFEYRCLLDAATENLRCGVSTVVTAPFVREFADGDWFTRLENRCAAHRARLSVVWMTCDEESMHDYIAFRGAGRDSWKLNNWHDYLATIDASFEPPFSHHCVANHLNGAVALADQARDIAARVRT